MEGRIVQKLECRPDADPLYMELKRGELNKQKNFIKSKFDRLTIGLSFSRIDKESFGADAKSPVIRQNRTELQTSIRSQTQH